MGSVLCFGGFKIAAFFNLSNCGNGLEVVMDLMRLEFGSVKDKLALILG